MPCNRNLLGLEYTKVQMNERDRGEFDLQTPQRRDIIAFFSQREREKDRIATATEKH